MGTVDYQVQRTPCPQCGDNSQVHTARELIDTLSGARQTTFQRFAQAAGQAGTGQPGQGGNGPGGNSTAQPQGQGGNSAGGPPPSPGGFAHAPFQSPGGNSTAQPQGRVGNYSGAPEPGQGGNSSGFQPQGQGGNSTGAPEPGQGGNTTGAPQPGQAWPAADQGQGAWPPAQQAGRPDDGNYDNYNVENSNRNRNRNWRRDIFQPEKLADDVGDAVLGAALGFAGRTIGRRMKKAFEERVLPAMEARAQQAQGQSQQQSEQSKAEQDAIVARYPELRGCMKDQVIFLDGGYKTLPASELTIPLTLAQADDIVARLR